MGTQLEFKREGKQRTYEKKNIVYIISINNIINYLSWLQSI